MGYYINTFERHLPLLRLQLWSYPCSVGLGRIRQKVKLDKIVVAQTFLISRKTTESLTKCDCYLPNLDTTVGC